MNKVSLRRGFSSDFLRALSWHRRKLAVIVAAGAALAVVHAARPAPPATLAVVRVVSDVPAGSTLTPAHLAVRPVVASAVPEDAITDLDAALGHRVLAGLTPGQVLTTPLLVSARAISRPGRVLTSLRLPDAGLLDLLQPGDLADVLATDPDTAATGPVARQVRVVALPDDESRLGGAGSEPVLLVEVDEAEAASLAEAAATRRLSLVLQ